MDDRLRKIKNDGKTLRQTDKETDRKTDRQTLRQTDRETETDTETDGLTDKGLPEAMVSCQLSGVGRYLPV